MYDYSENDDEIAYIELSTTGLGLHVYLCLRVQLLSRFQGGGQAVVLVSYLLA